LRHGPYALLGPGFPALLLAQRDATHAGVEALGVELARRGVPLLIAGADITGAQGIGAEPARAQSGGAVMLPTIDATPEIAPILLVQSAYRLIATLALRRGFDPDRPAHLRKVTETM